MVEKSVRLELKEGITIAKLPFLYNPAGRLGHNKGIAKEIYDDVVKKSDNIKKARGNSFSVQNVAIRTCRLS